MEGGAGREREGPHADHRGHPTKRKAHHGPHERHVHEEEEARRDPAQKHHKGGMGGNHDHPREWGQHSHPHNKGAAAAPVADTSGIALNPPARSSLSSADAATLVALRDHSRGEHTVRRREVVELFQALGASVEQQGSHHHGEVKVKLAAEMEHLPGGHGHGHDAYESKETVGRIRRFLDRCGI